MLVYRLENDMAEGCYTLGFGTDCARQTLIGDNSGDNWHPSPEYDGNLQKFWAGRHLPGYERYRWQIGERKKWFCAFESIEQLEAWFPVEGLIKMQAKAERFKEVMFMSVYKVPHHKVRKGNAQVVFHSDYAELQEQISLQELVDKLVNRAIT